MVARAKTQDWAERRLTRAGSLAVLALLLLGPLTLTRADSTDEALERCVYLHERIEHYTKLRRGGGTAARMESWRRSRARYEEEYRDLRCYRYGRRLRTNR